MDFAQILKQWEMQTGKNYSKEKTSRAKNNSKKPNPMDVWIKRNGVYDKDSEILAGEKIDPTVLRQSLRNMRPEAQIDLNGKTVKEAGFILSDFFDTALRQGLKKVLIIHGKGKHSKNDAVLRGYVKSFLDSHPNAGESGHNKNAEGGTGSTWVILKPSGTAFVTYKKR